jgi:hypothetical protein
MKALLIKLSEQHYVVVSDSEIKDVHPYKGRFHLEKGRTINQFPDYLTDLSECKIITHSTQPLESNNLYRKFDFINIKPLSLSEVEKAIYGYNFEKMANEKYHRTPEEYNEDKNLLCGGYSDGFVAAMELVKDKFILDKDKLKWLLFQVYKNSIRNPREGKQSFKEISTELIQSLLPPTQWDIEIDEQGKIKLLK